MTMMMIENKIRYNSLRCLMTWMCLSICTLATNAAPAHHEEALDRSGVNAGILLGIIALLLGIAALCLAVYVLLRQNKLHISVSEISDKIKKIDSQNSENSSNSRHDVEIDRLKRQVEALSDSISRKSVSVSNSEQLNNQQKTVIGAQNSSSSSNVYSENPRKSTQFNSKKLYVSVLIGNGFPNSTAVYTPGKTLYEIDTTDGVSGTIRFVDRKESIAIARRNLTQFVESVCLVQGAVPNNISGIRTIRPGRVTAVGSSWRLDEKAIVEYI